MLRAGPLFHVSKAFGSLAVSVLLCILYKLHVVIYIYIHTLSISLDTSIAH